MRTGLLSRVCIEWQNHCQQSMVEKHLSADEVGPAVATGLCSKGNPAQLRGTQGLVNGSRGCACLTELVARKQAEICLNTQLQMLLLLLPMVIMLFVTL